MHDLRGRFDRLDRIAAPNLWNEAVGRAAELELAPRPAFNPGLALIAMALLLAALGGTLAVGAWLDRTPALPEIVTYENGMIVGSQDCGQLIAIDPRSLKTRELGAEANCEEGPGVDQPAWSSDGSRLAYLVEANAGDRDVNGIWVYEAATGEARQLERCRNDSCSQVINISPDGSLILHVAYTPGGQSELVVTQVDSGKASRIELPSEPRHPRFSPDGSRIAFSMIGGRSGVYVVDIRGIEDGHIGSPTPLSGIIDADQLAWSPDGTWIAYSQSGGLGDMADQEPFNGQIGHSGAAIVITRTDGSETRILATAKVEAGPWFPTWSPDSESVAYVTTVTEGNVASRLMLELWTLAIDGGEPALIYASGCCKDGFGAPDWSPDGEWIAFGVGMPADPAESGTFLVRPDGSEIRRASTLMLSPVWQPIPEN